MLNGMAHQWSSIAEGLPQMVKDNCFFTSNEFDKHGNSVKLKSVLKKNDA